MSIKHGHVLLAFPEKYVSLKNVVRSKIEIKEVSWHGGRFDCRKFY